MVDLASLATKGPVKQEPTKRRVRGLLGGQWIFDTLDAVYVWEHEYFPVYYVPLAALQAGPGTLQKQAANKAGFWQGCVLNTSGQTAAVTVFETGPLAGLAKVAAAPLTTAGSAGGASTDGGIEWFAEDEKLLGTHPKDPYKRVECLASSREVRIELDGVVLARSTGAVFLHETGLRTRYYLPPTSVVSKDVVLQPSATTSFCPYKGQAGYYDVCLAGGGRTVRDGVWYYAFPTLESTAIQGRLSFYNEKFDVFVGGIKE